MRLPLAATAEFERIGRALNIVRGAVRTVELKETFS